MFVKFMYIIKYEKNTYYYIDNVPLTVVCSGIEGQGC